MSTLSMRLKRHARVLAAGMLLSAATLAIIPGVAEAKKDCGCSGGDAPKGESSQQRDSAPKGGSSEQRDSAPNGGGSAPSKQNDTRAKDSVGSFGDSVVDGGVLNDNVSGNEVDAAPNTQLSALDSSNQNGGADQSSDSSNQGGDSDQGDGSDNDGILPNPGSGSDQGDNSDSGDSIGEGKKPNSGNGNGSEPGDPGNSQPNNNGGDDGSPNPGGNLA